MKSFLLAILLLLFFLSCAQEQKIEYTTIADIPLSEKEMATFDGIVYKKNLYVNNIIKDIEFFSKKNNLTTKIGEYYYLSEGEDYKTARDKLGFKNNGPFYKIFEKKNIDGYTYIKEWLGDYDLTYTVEDPYHRIIASKRIYYSAIVEEVYEKRFYNKYDNKVLFSNMNSKSFNFYEIQNFYKIDYYKIDNPIQGLNWDESDEYLEKHFPYQNIDYYKNKDLIPDKEFINSYSNYWNKKIIYETELGTETSEKYVSSLKRYYKNYYSNEDLIKKELYENGKIIFKIIFIDQTEDEEKIIKKIDLPNFILVKKEKYKYEKASRETWKEYKNYTVISTTEILYDEQKNVLEFEKSPFSKGGELAFNYGYSKFKIMYNKKGQKALVCTYDENDELNGGFLYAEGDFMRNFSKSEWYLIKHEYFPNSYMRMYDQF